MCRRTLTSKVQNNYNVGKSRIISALSKVDHVCTTADAWKSRGKAYLGVTCHWLCPISLTRVGICLAIRRLKGSITYNVLASSLESINSEFGIEDKIKVTVTDSGSNFLKAFRLFSTDDTASSETAQKDNNLNPSHISTCDGFEDDKETDDEGEEIQVEIATMASEKV